VIWLALIGVSLLCALWLIAPLFAPPQPLDSHSEAGAYLKEIAKLDSGPETLARKTELERRVIAASQITILPGASFKVLGAALGVFLITGTAGLNLQAETQTAQVTAEPSLEEMAQRLKARLEDTPDSVEGWVLYGRTLMTLEDFAGAMTAYDTAIGLAPDNSSVSSERESAKAFIAQREAAMSMSVRERTEMIEGMVSGLAQRLADNPEDSEGWIRLLTSRRVLGQMEQGEKDVAAMRAHYQERPQEISRILNGADWPVAPKDLP